MVNIRVRGLHWLFLLGQVALASALFWFWLPLTQSVLFVADLPLGKYIIYNAVLALGVTVGHLTEPDKRYFSHPTFRTSTNNALWQLFFAAGGLFIYLVGTQDNAISRVFLFSFVPVLYGSLVLCQRYLPPLLIQASFSGPYEQRVALVGSSRKALALRDWLANKSDIGFKTVGIICDESGAPAVPGLKMLGALGDLERAIREWSITQIIVTGFPQQDHVLHHCIGICEKHGVRLLVLCDFDEKFGHAVTLFEDAGLRFVGLRQEPLEDPFNRFLKRALDLAVALPVTVFILPFATALVWVLQRRQSPGRVFYHQQRSGLQNRPFTMLKYRTMHVSDGDETKQAIQDDPRTFPAGRWLRRLSLDELPQFINVLKGDMSVVGPRPHLPRHNELFARALNNYYVRAVVKPGITGLAQVRGYRGATATEKDVAGRVTSDIQYLENWSFSLDCWIIARTVVQIIAPPNTAF
jgi:exopolysaccharide biosynthesis polyprenyl glycosylphosphotransferase